MSRRKTNNKTNIFLDDLSGRFCLIDDDAIGEFFHVSGSTVSAWRVKDNVPAIYVEYAKLRIDNVEKQNIVYLDASIGCAPEHQHLFEDLKAIVNSDRPETIKAIESNLREFRELITVKAEQKHEIETLKGEITNLTQAMAVVKADIETLKKPPPVAQIVSAAKPETSSD